MKRIILLMLFTAGAVNAGVVTVDASSFAAGTNITSSTPGITLREYTNYGVASGAVYNPAYAITNVTGLAAGINLIGRSTTFNFTNSLDAHKCFTGLGCNNGMSGYEFHSLLMNFAVPTNLLEVRVHFYDGWLDGVKLRIYNAQRQLLATCYVYGNTNTAPRYESSGPFSLPCGQVVQAYDCNSSGTSCNYEKLFRITRSIPDIAYAIWGAEVYDSGIGAVNQITFRRFSDCAP